jgi:hypothetical protein
MLDDCDMIEKFIYPPSDEKAECVAQTAHLVKEGNSPSSHRHTD